MKGVINMLFAIAFVIGGLIAFILYGKVPVIVSLAISTMVGGMIGAIHYKIKQKKAEQEWIEYQIYLRHLKDEES